MQAQRSADQTKPQQTPSGAASSSATAAELTGCKTPVINQSCSHLSRTMQLNALFEGRLPEAVIMMISGSQPPGRAAELASKVL
eukprot:2844133-Amphidinium_carterae.1